MAKVGIIEMNAPAIATRQPVLAVGLGRGSGGKSTALAEMVWRAEAQGRDVIVADGDVRSQTLARLFPTAMQPETEEMPDIKAVLDLGGGDRALLEPGRDMRLVEFCSRRGIAPLAAYCLGPDEEDLSHIHTIFRSGYFRPDRTILLMNEGVIRNGQHIAGAFDRTLRDERFDEITTAGARPLLIPRLACMGLVRGSSARLYKAAAGGAALDPVEEFMVEDWLSALEAKRHSEGIAEWLP